MSKLFRKEVMENQADRLHGEISLAVPIGWQLFSYLLLTTLVISTGFLFLADYARVETVSGLIVPDKGIAIAVPTRLGIVSELLVKEGQLVERGADLAYVTSGETLTTGVTAPSQVKESLKIQDILLLDQSNALAAASIAEQSRMTSQIAGLSQELRNIGEQITVQKSLVLSAKKDLESVQAVAERGFISRRDILFREEQLATRTQQLSQLEQTRASKTAQSEDARRAIGQMAAQAKAQSANLKVNQEEVARQKVDVSVAGGYTVTAPTSGMATAINVKAGQSVGPNTPLLSIIPKGSKLRAELPIPATMIGFIRNGQEVKLSIDAFPYQQFGTIKARITSIPGAPISASDSKGNPIPVYITIADIEDPYIMAFSKRQPLLSGMTLSARITTRKQSLLEWLFEPLYAVGRR